MGSTLVSFVFALSLAHAGSGLVQGTSEIGVTRLPVYEEKAPPKKEEAQAADFQPTEWNFRNPSNGSLGAKSQFANLPNSPTSGVTALSATSPSPAAGARAKRSKGAEVTTAKGRIIAQTAPSMRRPVRLADRRIMILLMLHPVQPIPTARPALNKPHFFASRKKFCAGKSKT